MPTVDAIYRRIGQLVSLDFAVAAAGGKVAKKNCKTGFPCGYSCISKSKACKSPIGGQAKTYADWMSRQAGKTPAAATKKTKASKPSTPTPTPQPAQPKKDVPDKTDAVSTQTKKKSFEVPKDQDVPAFPPGENFKKARTFNPEAVTDITPEKFKDWLDRKEELKYRDDPENPWNQSYEQFKAANVGSLGSKARYKTAILSAIRGGVAVSDDVLTANGIKLNKTQQAQLEKNKKDDEDERAYVARIQKAIDYPLVSEDEGKGYKPNMSTEEAMNYVKDSFFSGLSFYHGNPKAVIDSVESSGADPERNNRGIFGKGFYLAASFEEAKGYAASGTYDNAITNKLPAAVLAAAVKMKNPLTVDSAEYSKILQNFPGDQSNGVDSEAVTQYLRAKGHDGVYLKDYGYMVVLDQKQLVTHSRNDYSRDEIQSWQNNIPISERTWERVEKLAQNSITGKALTGL